ncbi:hypothetical protein L484_002846 [Morus notabilis]|uniref:Uncharacterized protein n=1 Tax=Morus notabilis TaxID=981085 RepID=W9S046_9ROSA|nr:hypothetical protein L484_002846 [Morus notabilis]
MEAQKKTSTFFSASLSFTIHVWTGYSGGGVAAEARNGDRNRFGNDLFVCGSVQERSCVIRKDVQKAKSMTDHKQSAMQSSTLRAILLILGLPKTIRKVPSQTNDGLLISWLLGTINEEAQPSIDEDAMAFTLWSSLEEQLLPTTIEKEGLLKNMLMTIKKGS